MPDEIVKPDKTKPLMTGQRGLVLSTLDDLWRMASYIHKSGLAPKSFRSVEALIVAMQYGSELGLTYAQSVYSTCVINGLPSLFGDAPLGLCYESGKIEGVPDEGWKGKGMGRYAFCTVMRKGSKPITRYFTMEDAKQAELLSKDNWRKYPDRMLQMRARSRALRDAFADVLKGMTIAEEQDPINEVPQTVTAEVVSRDERTGVDDVRTIDGEIHRLSGLLQDEIKLRRIDESKTQIILQDWAAFVGGFPGLESYEKSENWTFDLIDKMSAEPVPEEIWDKYKPKKEGAKGKIKSFVVEHDPNIDPEDALAEVLANDKELQTMLDEKGLGHKDDQIIDDQLFDNSPEKGMG